jgi:pilus assembly protein FimV
MGVGVSVSSRWPIALASTLAVVLALASGSAAALGLGQIQVKSKPGQPLLAEIPILSNDASELQGLQVRLASPDTFRRVGLEPPGGAAASLRFEPALDASGRPVVRVTSLAPVTDPELTFLLEVDWAQGRLVREYSALIDAPRTVAATPQPIQAPVVAPPNIIERPPAPPVVAAEPAPTTPPPPTPVPAPPKPVQAPPQAAPPPVASTATPSPSPAASTPAPVASGSSVYGPVQRGQTLGRIAATLDAAQDHTLAQTMLALLRANPDAFIGGNINQLKAGAVLRLPDADAFTRLDRRQAAALVHQQIVQWREARKPLPQAALAATASSPASAAKADASASRPRATRSRDARLEIVPPSSSRAQAGGDTKAMRSGTQAGGEGDMLQLQETRETLAARDAEVGELKTRVAELEKLQAQQQQLLTLKDSALAEAQQRLAAVNAKAAAPAATTTAPTQPAAPTNTGTPVWLWVGGVLVIAALIAWLLARRRPVAPVAPRRGFDTQALAAGMVAAPATSSSDKTAPASAAATEPPGRPAGKAAGRTARPGAATDARNAVAAPTETVVPPWHGGAAENAAITATVEVEPAEPARKLEQAQAFMAMGDDDTARELLRDVLNGRDPAARDRAARLLRDL